MYFFHNDYNEACHPQVAQKLSNCSSQQMPGYGVDECCERAAGLIRNLCGSENLSVHFLVGGTQCNLTVIDAALRPHQAAIGAIPLSMGLSCGQTVLTAAVLSILITAPIGAFLIGSMHQRLLNKQS